MRVIAMINQKGGVGKTTTVANLGSALAARGADVCLVDMDPQAHLTLHVGVEPGSPAVGMYELLTEGASFASATVNVADKLHLVPSVIDLAAAEIELVGAVGREQILADRIAAEPLGHELLIIDCPPSLGLLTLNALAAADEVIIPLQPHFLALQGLGKLLETVSLVQKRINPKLRVGGVVLCMYESGTKLAAEVVADLESFFQAARGTSAPWAQARIFRTVVRRNVKLAECPSHGKTIFDYEPRSNGAADYAALADEFLGGSGQEVREVGPAHDADAARGQDVRDTHGQDLSGAALAETDAGDAIRGQDARDTHGQDGHATHGQDAHVTRGQDLSGAALAQTDARDTHGQDGHATHGQDAHVTRGQDLSGAALAKTDAHATDARDTGAVQQ